MQKIRDFMAGRYGFDTLNGFLFGAVMVLWFVNIFVWSLIPSLIIGGVQLLLFAWLMFRALSRNINMRSLENRRFRKVFDPVKNWFPQMPALQGAAPRQEPKGRTRRALPEVQGRIQGEDLIRFSKNSLTSAALNSADICLKRFNR